VREEKEGGEWWRSGFDNKYKTGSMSLSYTEARDTTEHTAVNSPFIHSFLDMQQRMSQRSVISLFVLHSYKRLQLKTRGNPESPAEGVPNVRPIFNKTNRIW